MGKTGTRFGRNMPLEATYPEEQSMLDPSLARSPPSCSIEIARRTSPDSSNAGGALPPTYVNKVTPWWDGSQLYGSTEERNRQLRSGEDGKLRLEDGRLPEERRKELHGVDETGFSDNYWVGLSIMHTLFAREHNAICDMLKAHHPTWDDEQLFLKARLINAALIAKIHTIEWTPGILDHPALHRAMNANWYGVLPKWVKRTFGHIGSGELISGIVGSPLDHHTAPYSITSEFVTVYRMHPLLPDDNQIRSHQTDDPEWNEQIRDVYSGDIDKVDTQVGLLGEELPPGFGFSDTAFRIFILMVSRRLKSDRFFTSSYTPDVYTAEGLERIENSLFGDVLLRHHPDLAPALEDPRTRSRPGRA